MHCNILTAKWCMQCSIDTQMYCMNCSIDSQIWCMHCGIASQRSCMHCSIDSQLCICMFGSKWSCSFQYCRQNHCHSITKVQTTLPVDNTGNTKLQITLFCFFCLFFSGNSAEIAMDFQYCLVSTFNGVFCIFFPQKSALPTENQWWCLQSFHLVVSKVQ